MPYKDPIKARECARLSAQRYREKYPEKSKLQLKTYRLKHREKINQKRRDWYHSQEGKEYWKKENIKALERIRARRKKVIENYGNACQCCGESIYEFLTIDHVNGGGTKERETFGVTSLISKIIRENYPDDYRVLCYNCNCSQAYSKDRICPHNKLKT
jgi:hypothetical protein